MRKNAFAILIGITALAACGLKADPTPVDLARPRAISTLDGKLTPEGIALEWRRPKSDVGGNRLEDLGGFIVYRGAPGDQATEIGRIPVTDRERFSPQSKFRFLDKRIAGGETYYYRIISFTTDSYYSAPSNQVSVAVAR